MLHIFMVKSDARHSSISFARPLVLGETIPYWTERAIQDFIYYYCDRSVWEPEQNEDYTLAVINESYKFDDETEAARALFNSEAIKDDSDVLFVWDDVPAITAEALGALVDEHRRCDNISTWAHPDKTLVSQAWPLAFVAKGRHFRQGLRNAEMRNSPYSPDGVWRFIYPFAAFEFKEKFTHVFHSSHFAGQVKLLRERIVAWYTRNNVLFLQPERVSISARAKIGHSTLIYPDVVIEGDTVIGENCTIGPNVTLRNVKVAPNVTLEWQNLRDCEIKPDGQAG